MCHIYFILVDIRDRISQVFAEKYPCQALSLINSGNIHLLSLDNMMSIVSGVPRKNKISWNTRSNGTGNNRHYIKPGKKTKNKN